MAPKKTDENAPSVFLEFDTENWMAEPEVSQWDYDVDDINERLIEKYNLPDAEKHHNFLKEAIDIILAYPRIELQDDVIIVPSGLQEFKKSKVKFEQLINKLAEVDELLFALRCDATSDMLTNHFDKDNDLKTLTYSLEPAFKVIGSIVKLKGSVGGRPTGEWAREFCVHCQKFWSSQKLNSGTVFIFEGGRTTHITKWAEDVFEELRSRIGITMPFSKIRTVARHVKAYRPPEEPIIGDTTVPK